MKGLGFPYKVSQCYEGSKVVLSPQGAVKLAPGVKTWVRDEFTNCGIKLRFMELIMYQCFKYFLLSTYLGAARNNWYFTFIGQDKFSIIAKTTVRYREVKLCVRVTKMQIEFSTLLKSQVFGTDEILVQNSISENIWRVFPHN